MRKEFSTYLDALRFAASMAVVAAHFTFPKFIAGVQYQGALGGVAVSVFFVLSGYVIAYVAREKERTGGQYAISRMARVYSVAVPALLLTLAVDLFLMRHGGGKGLPAYQYAALWKYLPVFLVFGSEIGGFHDQVFGNLAFWSLSYEVWYYVAFGFFYYLHGLRRIVFVILTLVILGPRPLLYFPVWVLGALIYHAHRRMEIDHGTAAVGAAMSALALIALWTSGAYDWADSTVNAALNDWPKTHLHNSMNFPSHYLAGALTAAHIFFARYCKLTFVAGVKTRKAVVYLASFTFAIYLCHRPALDLWSHLIGHNPSSFMSVILLATLVIIFCWIFGFISEQQKGRWRALFEWIFIRRNLPRVLKRATKSSLKFASRYRPRIVP